MVVYIQGILGVGNVGSFNLKSFKCECSYVICYFNTLDAYHSIFSELKIINSKKKKTNSFGI